MAYSLLFGVARLVLVPLVLVWLFGQVIGFGWWSSSVVVPAWILSALFVNQIALAIFALRMGCVLQLWLIKIRWIAMLRIHLQSMFYFFVLPMTVGLEISRFVKIRAIQPGASAGALAGALLLDRVLGAGSALALALLCLPFVSVALPYRLSPLLIGLGAAALSLIAAGLAVWPRTRRLAVKVWLSTDGRRLHVAGLFVLSVAMHAVFAWGVQLAGRGIGLPIAFIDTCFAVAGGMLLVAIPVSLAGLGPAEAGAAALFFALGYEPAVAIAAGGLPYLARLVGAAQGGLWELFEGGTGALVAMRRIIARRELPQSP
jgi:hypothetical protein